MLTDMMLIQMSLQHVYVKEDKAGSSRLIHKLYPKERQSPQRIQGFFTHIFFTQPYSHFKCNEVGEKFQIFRLSSEGGNVH